MNPLTTSAFDLPERLAPKADPTLIAGDEQHFEAIAECLEQSIAEVSASTPSARRPAVWAGRRWTGTWRSTG